MFYFLIKKNTIEPFMYDTYIILYNILYYATLQVERLAIANIDDILPFTTLLVHKFWLFHVTLTIVRGYISRIQSEVDMHLTVDIMLDEPCSCDTVMI